MLHHEPVAWRQPINLAEHCRVRAITTPRRAMPRGCFFAAKFPTGRRAGRYFTRRRSAVSVTCFRGGYSKPALSRASAGGMQRCDEILSRWPKFWRAMPGRLDAQRAVASQAGTAHDYDFEQCRFRTFRNGNSITRPSKVGSRRAETVSKPSNCFSLPLQFLIWRILMNCRDGFDGAKLSFETVSARPVPRTSNVGVGALQIVLPVPTAVGIRPEYSRISFGV